MTLEDLFETLALGELSQHKFGKGGVIDLEDYPALISYTNRALTALHSRFPLQHKELLITQFDEITDYVLDPKYSISADDASVENKYIADSVEYPFLDDLLRVEAAFNGDGASKPLNDEYRSDSWYTPNPDTIQIPYPVEGNVAAIMYRANHAMIPTDTTDPSSVTINLPI